MTLEITLQVQQARLVCLKSKLHGVAVNPKNPKTIYYRVMNVTNEGITGTYALAYRRKIIYAGLQPTGFGHVYDGQNIPTYGNGSPHPAEATLFRVRHLVQIRPAGEIANKFVPTPEKKELPAFMLRDLTKNNLVEFLVIQPLPTSTTTTIQAVCEQKHIVLTLALYTDE
jgi:hypothetical protein